MYKRKGGSGKEDVALLCTIMHRSKHTLIHRYGMNEKERVLLNVLRFSGRKNNYDNEEQILGSDHLSHFSLYDRNQHHALSRTHFLCVCIIFFTTALFKGQLWLRRWSSHLPIRGWVVRSLTSTFQSVLRQNTEPHNSQDVNVHQQNCTD